MLNLLIAATVSYQITSGLPLRHDGYAAFSDELNTVNYHVWRQLSWDPKDDVESLWREWGECWHGADSDAYIAAMKASEKASVSTLSARRRRCASTWSACRVAHAAARCGHTRNPGAPRTRRHRHDADIHPCRHASFRRTPPQIPSESIVRAAQRSGEKPARSGETSRKERRDVPSRRK